MPDATTLTLAGVTLSDAEDSDLTQQDIDLAWGAIQDACEWHVAPVEEHTVTLDTHGEYALILPTLHVVDVSQVLVNGQDVTDQVTWSASGLMRLRNGRAWPDGYRTVQVTMQHGFEKVPTSLVALTLRNADAGLGTAKQVMAGPFLEIARDEDSDGVNGFSGAAKVVIDRYRRPVLPS